MTIKYPDSLTAFLSFPIFGRIPALLRRSWSLPYALPIGRPACGGLAYGPASGSLRWACVRKPTCRIKEVIAIEWVLNLRHSLRPTAKQK